MKIACVINSLSIGGAEKVLVELANYLSEHGHIVSIITFAGSGSNQLLPKESVQIYNLDTSTKGRTFLTGIVKATALIFKLRKVLRKLEPDRVLSFMDQANVATLLATLGLRTPIVVSERVHPLRSSLLEIKFIGSIFGLLRNLLYRLATRVVVQTAGAATYFKERGISRIDTIPNGVRPTQAVAELNTKQIITVGRLVPQKRVDLLIQAFSVVSAEFPEWSLKIIGDGALREQLEKLSESLKISQKVAFLGAIKAPLSELVKAPIFAITSDYEGFPNALVEAMSLGLAVISTNCDFGPNEIIRHEIDGLLVKTGSVDEIAHALQRLLADPELRTKLGLKAREVALRFNLDSVQKRWEELLVQIS